MHSSWFFVCLFFVSTEAILWKDCGSKLGKITNIQLQGCLDPDSKFCTVKRGSAIVANVKVDVNPGIEPINSATTIIHAVIAGVSIPWSPPNPEACNNGGLQCPVKPSSKTTYSMGVDIKSYYPSVRATIRWEVQDDVTKSDLICFIAPVIVSS